MAAPHRAAEAAADQEEAVALWQGQASEAAERCIRAAAKLGTSMQYGMGGPLVLVAYGADADRLWPLVDAAVKLNNDARKGAAA